jgi:hypothetical protein
MNGGTASTVCSQAPWLCKSNLCGPKQQ